MDDAIAKKFYEAGAEIQDLKNKLLVAETKLAQARARIEELERDNLLCTMVGEAAVGAMVEKD